MWQTQKRHVSLGLNKSIKWPCTHGEAIRIEIFLVRSSNEHWCRINWPVTPSVLNNPRCFRHEVFSANTLAWASSLLLMRVAVTKCLLDRFPDCRNFTRVLKDFDLGRHTSKIFWRDASRKVIKIKVFYLKRKCGAKRQTIDTFALWGTKKRRIVPELIVTVTFFRSLCKIHAVLCSKIADVHGIEVNDVRAWKFVYFRKIFRFLLHHTRDIKRGKGGTIPLSPNHCRGPKSHNNVITYKHFFQNSTFAFERPRVRTWGRQTCFLPQAPSNLVSPLHITIV